MGQRFDPEALEGILQCARRRFSRPRGMSARPRHGTDSRTSGSGTIDGRQIEAGNFGIDDVLVTHDKATRGFVIENAGTTDLVLFKVFGPDVNPDVPLIKTYPR